MDQKRFFTNRSRIHMVAVEQFMTAADKLNLDDPG